MSSLGSLSSISLATVTPSLVIVGLPNFLSMTMLRPFGPSVGDLAVAHGDDLALLGLFLRRVGNDDPALFDFLLLEPLHQQAIVQRTNLHRPAPSFGFRNSTSPFIMALDTPKGLPINRDEHDGLIPCRAVHPDGRCHRFRARCLPHAARHYGLMPRRPIHPGRRSHRSGARIDTLPYAAGRLPLTPARRCPAVAFFEAIL